MNRFDKILILALSVVWIAVLVQSNFKQRFFLKVLSSCIQSLGFGVKTKQCRLDFTEAVVPAVAVVVVAEAGPAEAARVVGAAGLAVAALAGQGAFACRWDLAALPELQTNRLTEFDKQ